MMVMLFANLVKLINDLILLLHVVIFKFEFTIEPHIRLLRVMRVHHLSRVPHQHLILRAPLQMLVRLRVTHHLSVRVEVGHHSRAPVEAWG
jgi:hypothetical protein